MLLVFHSKDRSFNIPDNSKYLLEFEKIYLGIGDIFTIIISDKLYNRIHIVNNKFIKLKSKLFFLVEDFNKSNSRNA